MRTEFTEAIIKRLDQMDKNLLAGFHQCVLVAETALQRRIDILLRMHDRIAALEERVDELERKS